jgi:hypothetical protein
MEWIPLDDLFIDVFFVVDFISCAFDHALPDVCLAWWLVRALSFGTDLTL